MLDMGPLIREGARVLRGNYVLAIPTVLAVFLASFISLGVVRSPEDTERLVLMGFLSMLISLYAYGVTLAMAREAIETGGTSLRTASFIATRLFSTLLGASLMVTVSVMAGSMLFLVPGLAAAFLLMFVFPAIVVDTVGVLEAAGRSVALVRANVKDSLLIFGVLIAFGLIFGMVNIILSTVAVVGQLAGVAVSGGFVGFVSVLMVRAYKIFRARTPQQA